VGNTGGGDGGGGVPCHPKSLSTLSRALEEEVGAERGL